MVAGTQPVASICVALRDTIAASAPIFAPQVLPRSFAQEGKADMVDALCVTPEQKQQFGDAFHALGLAKVTQCSACGGEADGKALTVSFRCEVLYGRHAVKVAEGELLCGPCNRLRNDPTWLLNVLATTDATGADGGKSADLVGRTVNRFLLLNEIDLGGNRIPTLSVVQECTAAVHALRTLQKPFVHGQVLLPAACTPGGGGVRAAAGSDGDGTSDDDDEKGRREVAVTAASALGKSVVRCLFARLLKSQERPAAAGSAQKKRRKSGARKMSGGSDGDTADADWAVVPEGVSKERGEQAKRRRSMFAGASGDVAKGKLAKKATKEAGRGRRKSSAT